MLKDQVDSPQRNAFELFHAGDVLAVLAVPPVRRQQLCAGEFEKIGEFLTELWGDLSESTPSA